MAESRSVPPEPPTLIDAECAKILRDIERDACQDGYILGKWPRTQDLIATRKLCATIAALRAEVAALKSDEERLDWLEKWLPEQPGHRRLVFDRSVPEFTLFQSDDNVRRLGMKKTLRAAIDAARAASGEDASR